MKKILIVLPSRPQNLETFLKILVDELSKSSTNKYYFVCVESKFNIHKLWEIILALRYINRLFRYSRLNNLCIQKTLKNIYINLGLFKFSKIDIIHYTFSNLAVSNYFIGKIYNAPVSIGFRGYDITFFPINHPGCYNNSFGII